MLLEASPGQVCKWEVQTIRLTPQSSNKIVHHRMAMNYARSSKVVGPKELLCSVLKFKHFPMGHASVVRVWMVMCDVSDVMQGLPGLPIKEFFWHDKKAQSSSFRHIFAACPRPENERLRRGQELEKQEHEKEFLGDI